MQSSQNTLGTNNLSGVSKEQNDIETNASNILEENLQRKTPVIV